MFEQFALPVFAGLLAALGSYIALFNLGSLNKRFKLSDSTIKRAWLFLTEAPSNEIEHSNNSCLSVYSVYIIYQFLGLFLAVL